MDLNRAAKIVNQLLERDRERDENYAEIDRAVGVEYENPPELRSLSWIGDRKFPTTAFSDAAHAATRAFATRKPRLTIFPVVDDPAEYAQMERIETAMEWEFERLNRIGHKHAHWQVVESAMKYCAVAIQTEYLPYSLKGKEEDRRVKSILRRSKFTWNVHHPSTVHAAYSDYGIETVVKAVPMTVRQLIEKFGDDNPGIQQLKAEYSEDNKADMYSDEYNFFDLYTWDERVMWASPDDESGKVVASGDGYEFLNEKHDLPFIPWVIIDNNDPVMLPAIKAGLYDSANMLNTIIFSKAVDMAAHPELWIRTIDGTLRNVSIDNTNPSQPLVTDKTAEVAQLRPPQIDPQLATMQAEAKSDIFRSTVAQILSDIDRVGQTATFSTVNAMLEAAITQLALGQNAAEQAETGAFYQMFEWIEYADIPLIAYRRKADKGNPVGQELVIQPNYTGENPNIATYDLDYLYLEVKLESTSISDKQAELNNEVLKVERLGKPRAAAMEAIGEENYEAGFLIRAEEDLALAEIAAETARIQMKPQLEAQAAQMQAQQAAMQGQGQQTAVQNAQGEQRGQILSPQQGTVNRAGGAGEMGAVPGMTPESMTGQTAGGQGMV